MEQLSSSYYLAVLRDQFQHRMERNSQYSLRAFAKDLQTNAGQLSRVLGGKLPLSFKRAEIIAECLNLQANERQLFLGSVANSQLKKGPDKQHDKQRDELIDMGATLSHASEMDLDTFIAISNLQHFAILELTYLENFRSDPRWISKQLGITVIEVQDAIARLKKLGLLKQVDNKLVKTNKKLSIIYKQLGSTAFRNMHKSSLRCALAALHKYPAEERHNHSITLAIDPEKLSLARKMLQENLAAIVKVLESGKQQKIYQLTLALNPIDLRG